MTRARDLADSADKDIAGTLTLDDLTVGGTAYVTGDLTVDTDTLYVDTTNDRIGVGTTNPGSTLSVTTNGAEAFEVFTTSAGSFVQSYNRSTSAFEDITYKATNQIFLTGGTPTEHMRIDSSGRKLFGHDTALTLGNDNSFFQVIGSGSNDANITIARFQNSNYGPYLNLVKSRSATKGSSARVNNNDYIGGINWYADDGYDSNTPVASIEVQMDNNTGSNDMPGRLMFRTTPDGSNATVERMRIDSAGRVTMPYQPAFRAYLSTEWTTISAYVNSGWTEQYDRNNNFNQGTFTAPVTGVYNFTVAWDALATQSRLNLERNGSYAGGFRYEPTGLTNASWETHSYSADVYLNANDYVKLYLEGGGGTNPIHMGGNQWGFFAGHLVG